MSDSVGASGNPTAWDPDHYSGFNAKIEEFDYKFLRTEDHARVGERGALARDNLPERWWSERLP